MLAYAIWAVVSVAWITLTHGQGITTFYVTIMGAYVVAATLLPLQAFFAAAAVAFVIGNPTARASL